MTKTAPVQQPPASTPKRKPHRRGAPGALGPTGGRQTGPSAERQCVVCRQTQPARLLLQLGDRASLTASTRAPGKRNYVCVRRACFIGLALRERSTKLDRQAVTDAQLEMLVQLATARFVETLGLARRQGLLVMGASRLIALRPSASDLFIEDDDDDDDDDENDEDTSHRADADIQDIQTDTVVDVGPPAYTDILAAACNRGDQDVIVVANDAALRTVRRLGPMGIPCMLSCAAMGHAAGGAPVAAVGIPVGRLALQAAYWLQVWYEARLADHTRANDQLRWRDE